MRRRLLCVLALASLLPQRVGAQPQTMLRRIGVLSGGARPASLESSLQGAFLKGMRELGYVEGRDFVVEWRFAEGKYERFPDFAADLVRLNVDVIVAFNTRGAVEAQRATNTIPIVFAGLSDPLGSGLVTNLARPGANITGVSEGLDDTILKHLDLMQTMIRPLGRIACLINPDNPYYKRPLTELQARAKNLGVVVSPVNARNHEELEAAFAAMKADRAQAVLVFDDSFFMTHRNRLAELAQRHLLPAMAGNREYAQAGLLFSYGELIAEQFRRGAYYVDKIFRGAKPGDLPVQQTMRYHFVINRRTASALGLSIPQEMLLRADEVID